MLPLRLREYLQVIVNEQGPYESDVRELLSLTEQFPVQHYDYTAFIDAYALRNIWSVRATYGRSGPGAVIAGAEDLVRNLEKEHEAVQIHIFIVHAQVIYIFFAMPSRRLVGIVKHPVAEN